MFYNTDHSYIYYDVWNIEIDINNVIGLTVHYFIEIVNLDPNTVHKLTLYYIQSSRLELLIADKERSKQSHSLWNKLIDRNLLELII